MSCSCFEKYVCSKANVHGLVSNIIKWAALVIAVSSLVSIISIFIVALVSRAWHFRFTLEGFKNMLSFWMQYSGFFKAFLLSGTLYVAVVNLEKYINVEICRSLGEIRTKLNSDNKKKLHEYLLDEEDKNPVLSGFTLSDSNGEKNEPALTNIELFDYLGTIELGAIMLKRGVITLDEFKNQFGYRLENICNNKDLLKHCWDNRKYYKYLKYAAEKLDKSPMGA